MDKNVLNVVHIGITVSNIEKSIDFYKNVLGLSFIGEAFMEGEETEKLFNMSGCKAKLGYLNGSDNIFSPSIELIEFVSCKSEKDLPKLNKISISEICFLTLDIDKAYNDLLKKGVEFISKPQYFDFTNYGFNKSKAVYFKDPDGIILELMEYIK